MTDIEKQQGRFAPTETDLAFFGRITASVTHELNNVMSIIEQTAGLLDDLIAGEERGIPITTERLAGVAASVEKQTQRGLGIIESLNRFAHTTDSAAATFDLNDVVGNLAELSRRFASLQRIRLDFKPAASPLQVVGNPLAVQRAVFESLLIALTCGAVNHAATAEIQEDDGTAGVVVRWQGGNAPGPERMSHLEDTTASAGGACSMESAESGTRLSLRFPRRPPA